MKTTKLVLAALMIASMLMLGAASSVPAADTIKVGEIQTYSKLTNFTFPYRNGWQLALEEINNAGGVMGKMISLQSLAVAVAATGMARSQEGELFRFTFKHSVFLASVLGLLTCVYAYA